MKKCLTAACCMLILPACLPIRGVEPGVIEGKALFRKSRVSGAQVRAVRDLGVAGLERAYTTRSDGEGLFHLGVPPGSYYLSFAAEQAGGKPGLYGFFGGNPVNVHSGITSQVALRGMEWSGASHALDSVESGLEGRAYAAGEPVPGAVIQVFLDAAGRFRGPGYASATTDREGRFGLNLPPGRYFVVARQRHGTGKNGPLRMGDRYAWYPGNPVFLPEGKRIAIELPFLEVEKEPSLALAEASRVSLVSGRVTAPDGRPVEGVYLCLYPGPEPLGMPRFVSDPSGADGGFVIRAAAAGSFYLVARSYIGKPLGPGEHVSFYRGPSGHRINLEVGKDLPGLSVIWEAR